MVVQWKFQRSVPVALEVLICKGFSHSNYAVILWAIRKKLNMFYIQFDILFLSQYSSWHVNDKTWLQWQVILWWIKVEPGTVRHPATVSVSVCLRGYFLFQAGNPANEVKPVVCYLNEVFEYPNMHRFFVSPKRLMKFEWKIIYAVCTRFWLHIYL